MNGSGALIRAVRGPIMMITTGTLFAVDQMTQFSIWQTCPVLLIMLGILKLAERSTGGPTTDVTVPPTGGYPR